MKKLIFIGGTARSGSTLLDLIISNDPKAMSLGEIHALFHPTRKHHFEEIKRVSQSQIWKKILKEGKKNLYANLIKYYPDVDIFIDSSKSTFWYKFHMKNKKDDYDIRNVLIYKTPSELANSFIKRGKQNLWVQIYKKYHRKYFSLIEDFVSISYKDLIIEDKYLEQLCNVLGLEYFKNKKDYWEKKHETFFGSNTVKSENSHNATDQLFNQTRQTITYDRVNKNYLEFINKTIEKNPQLIQIENEIRKKDVFHKNINFNSKKLGYNNLYMILFHTKFKLKNFYYYYFPEDIFKKT